MAGQRPGGEGAGRPAFPGRHALFRLLLHQPPRESDAEDFPWRGETVWCRVAQVGAEREGQTSEAADRLWGGQCGVHGWGEACHPPRVHIHREASCKRSICVCTLTACISIFSVLYVTSLGLDYNFNLSHHLLCFSRWTSSRWMCHVTQSSLTQRAAVSSPVWSVNWDTTPYLFLCYRRLCSFKTLISLYLCMAVWRVCRDRSNSWKSSLQMFARTTRHSGTSGAKGKCTCTVNIGWWY